MTRIRKSTYRPGEKIKQDFSMQLMTGEPGYSERFNSWANVLSKVSPIAILELSGLLASLGYSPDDNGRPIDFRGRYFDNWTGNKQSMDPVVYLSSIFELRTYYLDHDFRKRTATHKKRDITIRQRAAILNIAIYRWAGISQDVIDAAIKQGGKDIDDWDKVTIEDVEKLLWYCDLDSFMKRRRFSYTKERIKGMFDTNIVERYQLQDMLRKYKGRK